MFRAVGRLGIKPRVSPIKPRFVPAGLLEAPKTRLSEFSASIRAEQIAQSGALSQEAAKTRLGEIQGTQSPSLRNRKTGQMYRNPNYFTKEQLPKAKVSPALKPKPTKSAEPLAQEAQTLEEFVKAQIPVFRASEKGFDPKLMSKEGTYVSPSENIAGFFGEGKTRPVENLYLSPNAKGLEWKDLPAQFKNFDGKDIAEVQTAGAEWARKRGYDIIYNEKNIDYPKGFEWQVLNPDVIKTKSQLTDIWKRAQKIPASKLKKQSGVSPIRGLIGLPSKK